MWFGVEGMGLCVWFKGRGRGIGVCDLKGEGERDWCGGYCLKGDCKI
jgi:hypothetical protein